MATKKTDAAKAAVKGETKKAAAAVKETAAKAEKATKAAAEKVEKEVKTAASTAKKATKEASEKVEKEVKAAAKKTAAKKPASKKAATTETYFEFAGKQFNADLVKDAVVKAYVDAGNKASSIKSVKIYVKAEDSAAYFVINDKDAGKIAL